MKHNYAYVARVELITGNEAWVVGDGFDCENESECQHMSLELLEKDTGPIARIVSWSIMEVSP